MQAAAKSAWIIGGAGFLGSVLASLCRAEGWRVLVVDPAAAAADDCLAADAAGAFVFSHALSISVPDVVFFCASTRGGDAAVYERTYVEPVRRAVESLGKSRLVFCSSCAVYEDGADVTEQSPTPGGTERLRALLTAERAVLCAGGAVARLAALYGPGRCELLRRHCSREPRLPGPPERVLNYVHVQDAARALLLIAGAALPQRVYNVCAESFSVAQAYDCLAELTGVPVTAAESAPGRRGAARHRISAERLRAELNWQPSISFRDFVNEQISLA